MWPIAAGAFFSQFSNMHKKKLPFLDPRAATETCVTNEAELFQVRTCLGLSGD